MFASETARDLRVPLIAIAVWAGAWCGTSGGWFLAAAAGLVVVLGSAAWRLGSRVLVMLALCVVVSSGLGAMNWWMAQSSPLRQLAIEKAVVRVEGVVSSDPVVWQPRGNLPALTVVACSVRSVEARGQMWRMDETASLALTSTTPHLVVGQTVAVTAKATWVDDSLMPQVRLQALGDVRVTGQPSAWDNAVNRLRAGLRDGLAHSPPDQAGLVPGMVVGDTTGMPADLRDAFKATSLSYLIAVSGLNVTLTMMFVGVVAKAAGMRGWWLRGLSLVALVAFAVLCRTGASVLRAAAMGVVGLVASGVSVGPGGGLRRWGVAVTALCLARPEMTHSWGFAMSAAATAGILVWSPQWAQAMRQWAPAWLAEAVTLPLAAQLATQPLVTALNGQISVVGLFASMVAVPFVGPVIVLGLMACLVSPVWPAAASALGWAAGWCSEPIILVARGGARLPGATLAWGAAQWGGAVFAIGLLVACCWLISRAMAHLLRRWWSAGLALVVLAVGAVLPLPSPGWPGPWVVAFCDVGQGDASVLNVGAGVGVLVDAGPDPPLLQQCLADLGIRRLALVLISHQHADHIEGARGLAKHVAIDLVLLRGGLPNGTAQQVAQLFGDASVPVQATWDGQVVAVGPLVWTTLRTGPLAGSTSLVGEGEDPQENNASTIGVAELGGLRVMFTGDAEPDEQAAVLAATASLRVDILKVPHHGSSRQDTAFLAAMSATVAVISVGAGNSYGHPAATTLAALQRDGMVIYRTDQVGAVAISFGAATLQVRAQHRPL